ncbi:MAG TPA: glycoside hydrolase family 38 C-terminal domain-containing protein [Planctomycetota bacterium]|nr:glycoside hydrolase family 38 C-terminal domain-containing protein [Planctomycetota bacterium]
MDSSRANITVHMIGNAHIDPVWLWRAEEGFQVVRETCRSALERMEETPGFTFCRSSAATCQWLEEREPELFEQIRQRVAEGRWCIVGGWWEQPDCNIPCGESFVRQALYGKRYFQQKFGVDVRVGYNVDSFGHAGTLPQILKKCGLDTYVFFRPGPHEKTLPAGLFLWQAPDGSQVLACRPPHHYCCGPDEIAERIRQAADQAPLGLGHVMCFYGVGDHGGGPTKANIASILQVAADPEGPNAIFSTPQRFFEAVEGERGRLPVVADELQHHARGCYTVVSDIKRMNHECEELLLVAERFAAIATAAFGAEPQQPTLSKAWETVLFHQFHDVLAGTSIPEAYDDAWPLLDEVRGTAMRIITESLEEWGRHIDTTRGASPITFFNPLGFDREDVIELEPQEDAPKLALFDEQFNEVPVQRVEGHVVFRTRLRSLGFACYHLSTEHEPQPAASGLVATPTSIENGLVAIELDPKTGGLLALRDKRQTSPLGPLGPLSPLEEKGPKGRKGPKGQERRNLLAGPGAALVVLRDASDTWSHGVAAFRDEIGRFEPVGPPEIVEKGPVRAAIRVRSRWGDSTAEQTFYLYDAMARIDVCLVVDWHERHKMLKLAFPTAIETPVATFAVPYGCITRPTNGEEEPVQRWIDLSGTVGGQPAGLALINDGKYGADVLGSEMRLSLLRSPIYAFHDPRKPEPGVEYQYTDQGEHVIRYRLVPHGGSWHDAGVVREAQSLNVPVFYRFEDVQDGTISSYGSAVELKPDNLLLTVLKKAEEGDGLVVRFVETAGRATEARVDIHFAQAAWTGRVGPFEIKTLRFDLEARTAHEVDMMERET